MDDNCGLPWFAFDLIDQGDLVCRWCPKLPAIPFHSERPPFAIRRKGLEIFRMVLVACVSAGPADDPRHLGACAVFGAVLRQCVPDAHQQGIHDMVLSDDLTHAVPIDEVSRHAFRAAKTSFVEPPLRIPTHNKGHAADLFAFDYDVQATSRQDLWQRSVNGTDTRHCSLQALAIYVELIRCQ